MAVDDGFRAMYEAEFANVCRTVTLMCGDPTMSEDATQEAFARALSRWRRLRDVPWAAGWVTTTAINVARRDLRRRPMMSTTPPQPIDPEAELDLRAAVASLPPRQQEAVALFYLLDMSVMDSAAAMGCDEATVKTHLARARATLARELRDEAEVDAGEAEVRRPSDG
jgi:RNA polymerase sigma-70 factor (ECF subfamily)